MPLLGHAFVGLATGMIVGPLRRGRLPARRRQRVAVALWLPATVGFAYLPDVATQIALLLGIPLGRTIAHSLVFALAVSPPVALLGAWLGALPRGRMLAVVLSSVLLHDALDLAQSTDRLFWWPFSTRPAALGPLRIPADATHEAMLFTALFAVFVGVFALARRRRIRLPDTGLPRTLVWARALLIMLFVVGAGVVHSLGIAREHRLDEARALLEQHRYAAALDALAEAERWPLTAKPGRIDHLRGEAWLGLADRGRAERYYRRSYETDPHFFWIVADLAVFHASGDGSPAERRRESTPYIEQLRRDFSDHKVLPAILARVEEKLQRRSGSGP